MLTGPSDSVSGCIGGLAGLCDGSARARLAEYAVISRAGGNTMSIKSSLFYVTVDAVDGEGASVHVYADVTTQKILMDLSYASGTYGTQLGFQLGTRDVDGALTRLLEK